MRSIFRRVRVVLPHVCMIEYVNVGFACVLLAWSSSYWAHALIITILVWQIWRLIVAAHHAAVESTLTAVEDIINADPDKGPNQDVPSPNSIHHEVVE